MSARDKRYPQHKPNDKAPNGARINVIFMKFPGPGKDEAGNLKAVNPDAPPAYTMVPVEACKLPCYQSKVGPKSNPKTVAQQQYHSDALLDMDPFECGHRVKSFSRPSNLVPGGLYTQESLWYANFLDEKKPELGVRHSLMSADLVPNVKESIADYVAKAPFQSYALTPRDVKTEDGFEAPDPKSFTPDRVFVAKLLPTKCDIDSVLAAQPPGTVYAWTPTIKEVERQHVQILDKQEVATPCITLGKEGTSQNDLQTTIYQKNPDGSDFPVLMYHRLYYGEALRPYQMTHKQCYAILPKMIGDICGTLICSIKAEKTSKILTKDLLEDHRGVCNAKSILVPDVAHMARAVGNPVSRDLAQRIFASHATPKHLLTESFNVMFWNAFNVLSCSAELAKKCLDHADMLFYLVTDHAVLDADEVEMVAKLTDDQLYDIFLKGSVKFPEGVKLKLGYKTVPSASSDPAITGDASIPKDAKVPGGVVLYAALPADHPNAGKPLSLTLNSRTPAPKRDHATASSSSAAAPAPEAAAAPTPAPAPAEEVPAAAAIAEVPAAAAAPSPAKRSPAGKPAKKAKTAEASTKTGGGGGGAAAH